MLVAALAAANALLIWQNLQLRQEVGRAQPRRLKAGERVEPFKARGLDGSPFEVNYAGGGRKKVLLYFTPSCPFCCEQFVYWREMLARPGAGRYEVIGLASDREDRDRLRQYLETMGCSAESQTPLRVALIPDAVRDRYLLDSTPITLVISGDGTVEQSLVGRWDERDLETMSAALGSALLSR